MFRNSKISMVFDTPDRMKGRLSPMKRIVLAIALLAASGYAAWRISPAFCCAEDPPPMCPPIC